MKINQFNRGQDAETHPRVRILVTDDTSSSRELLCAILDGCGYEVAEITDPFRFLERAIAFEPHLVILGLQMPELDGYAAASLLRRQPALEKVPMIALTAAVSEISVDRIAAVGFTTYLVKPIGPDRLRCCIASLL